MKIPINARYQTQESIQGLRSDRLSRHKIITQTRCTQSGLDKVSVLVLAIVFFQHYIVNCRSPPGQLKRPLLQPACSYAIFIMMEGYRGSQDSEKSVFIIFFFYISFIFYISVRSTAFISRVSIYAGVAYYGYVNGFL